MLFPCGQLKAGLHNCIVSTIATCGDREASCPALPSTTVFSSHITMPPSPIISSPDDGKAVGDRWKS